MTKARVKKANGQPRAHDAEAQILAISNSQPIGYYGLDGTILEVNQRFEALVGYVRAEMIGKHVSMFVDEPTRRTADYQKLLEDIFGKLRRGETCSGEGRRVVGQGKEIWVHYSYIPVNGPDGHPVKVVNLMRDITSEKKAIADYQGQIAAISKAQAVIEFRMDGTVITANQNFLNALGYTLEEIQGKHHSMFVAEALRNTEQYHEFWAKLRRGEYQAGEYQRIGKNGREVWTQASYSPILDLSGKPYKVVKYASDITAQKQAVSAMMSDAMMLSNAAIEGKLSTRADANRHQGEYRKVIEGVNATLDAVINPLNVAARYVDDISQGLAESSGILQAMAANDYTRRVSEASTRVKITDTYNGDFNTIKNNLNTCIDALAGVATATNKTADTLVSSMQSIAGNSQSLSSASQQLAATSQQMSSNAEETAAKANTVASATQQVTTNLNSVATGAEEMTSTVHFQQCGGSRQNRRRGGQNRNRRQCHHCETGRIQRRDRPGDQSHHLDCPADQFTGSECDHRSGPRRRSRKRIRRRRKRGQGTRETNRQGDRGHQRKNHRNSAGHEASGGVDWQHHERHQSDQRHLRNHRHCGRAAERDHQ